MRIKFLNTFHNYMKNKQETNTDTSTKYVQDLYNKNYKILLKDYQNINEDPDK